MKASELNILLKPMKIPLKETAHLVLEPNLTCNIECKVCYNQYKDLVKPFDQIKSEIDIGLEKRNLETISILGGEPTLHPELIKIVHYIKSKKLTCQLLTKAPIMFHR